FFQAEDGIRDRNVTGVQTCALPIWPGVLFAMKFQPPKQQPLLVTLASADDLKSEKVVLDPNVLDTKGTTAIDWFVPSSDGRYVRSEERRVGKEWRCRGEPYDHKKKR